MYIFENCAYSKVTRVSKITCMFQQHFEHAKILTGKKTVFYLYPGNAFSKVHAFL